jgi:hypothetical protein
MEIEVAERASRRIQRHRDQSEVPAGKTFASFDFDAAPGVRKQYLLALGTGGGWIRNGDNLLLFGKSGTGKGGQSTPHRLNVSVARSAATSIRRPPRRQEDRGNAEGLRS